MAVFLQVHPSMPRVAWEFLSGEVDESCADDDACLQVRQRLFYDAIFWFILKLIILTRQARDEHREN